MAKQDLYFLQPGAFMICALYSQVLLPVYLGYIACKCWGVYLHSRQELEKDINQYNKVRTGLQGTQVIVDIYYPKLLQCIFMEYDNGGRGYHLWYFIMQNFKNVLLQKNFNQNNSLESSGLNIVSRLGTC
eukprot:TRINITY_DN764_c2_g1_i1.p5 TRINITY_DN764_c2_g1~~TRINITY_DN764_c2_g1_i1.p5  ORF type:complete len:130 (-),score=4.42 TRINITY_DN764_c2_g1_i1:808-1197(-)